MPFTSGCVVEWVATPTFRVITPFLEVDLKSISQQQRIKFQGMVSLRLCTVSICIDLKTKIYLSRWVEMATNTVSPKTTPLRMISEKLFRSPKKVQRKGINQSSMQKRGFNLDEIPLDAIARRSHYSTTAAKMTTEVVVAIDFGTTYSGYAYAFTSSPDEIHLMRRPEGGQFGTMTHKIPTILLLNEKGAFHSFGYEARETYLDLNEEEAQKWFYFEKFKMELHSRKVCCVFH